MMAVSLFCQDFREEVAGTATLIGIYPDNIEMGEGGTALAKLVVYTRINLAVDEPQSDIAVSLRAPNGSDEVVNAVPFARVEAAIEKARLDGNNMAGIVARIEGSPFVASPGRYLVVVRYDGQEYVTGTIRFSGAAFETSH